MNAKPNLKKLMNHGYWGNIFVEGIPPIHVELALKQVFDRVVIERLPGAWNYYEFEWRCFDTHGDLRLNVQYGWTYNGWRYQPVAVRKPIRSVQVSQASNEESPADSGYRLAA